MTSVRTRKGQLQLPVDTHAHPDGRTVTLIGMIHVGDPEFYDAVADLVAERERQGDLIQYERITADMGDATDEERDLVTRLRTAKNLTGFAGLLGLTAQHQVRLPVQPSWVNTDMSAVQVVRALPDPEAFVARQEKAAKSLADMDLDDRLFLGSKLRWVLRNLGWLYPLIDFTSSKRPGYRQEQAVLIDQRNALAIDAIVSAGRSVTALWGSAHLAGIGAGLAAHGFRHTSRTWQIGVRKTKPKHAQKAAA